MVITVDKTLPLNVNRSEIKKQMIGNFGNVIVRECMRDIFKLDTIEEIQLYLNDKHGITLEW